MLPKFIDILLAFDFNQPHLVPLLCLQEDLFRGLLLDVGFIVPPLFFYLLEEPVVILTELCGFGSDVAGPVDAHVLEDATVGARFLVDGSIMFLEL
jgi:hypothetical protein